MILARLALTEVPADERSAVVVEPIFDPKMMYSTALEIPIRSPASLYVPPKTSPALAIPMIIVVTADEDCINVVNTIPNISNTNGFVIPERKPVTAGLSDKGSIAVFIT